MRIVYVLTTLAVGGTERQVLAIAARMQARGHAVALLVLTSPEADDCPTALDVLHLDIRKTASSLIAGLRRAVAFLRSFRPDLIHSHNFHGNMLGRLLRLFYPNAKLISTIHNVYEGGSLRMWAYRMTRGLADQTTAVSAAVAARFMERKAVARNKCLVVSNGIDTDEFVPDPKRRAAMRAQMNLTDEFVWLTVGRITAAKDPKNLLEAFGNLCRTNGQAQLWIAGEARPRSSRKYKLFPVATSEGRERTRWLGLRQDIPAVLDAADAFVLASAWEGMPLAVGEAMAMEKPFVVTGVGGVPELAGDAGVLVPPRNADALASAMRDVMRLPAERRDAMGCAARERILNHFSIEAKVTEWEQLYRAVAGHSTLRPVVVPWCANQNEHHSRHGVDPSGDGGKG